MSSYSVDFVFSKIQSSKNHYVAYKQILTEIYEKTEHNIFMEEFFKCIKIALMHEEKSQCVENTLDFAAEFAVSFRSQRLREDENPILEAVFQLIFDSHEVQVQVMRTRLCQLLDRLLDKMGHNASVHEETFRNITEHMLQRLQDSMTSVRSQAVNALQRLQDPYNEKCSILKAFLFHLTYDPCHEVRRSIMEKIAVNKFTLPFIFTRMNDVKDVVRKEAYVILNRYSVQQFTIKQCQQIIESGLGDASELCRDYVTGVLIPNWLKKYNYDYYEFLSSIAVDKMPETGIKLLKINFSKSHDVILESKATEMGITDGLIPYDKLDITSVIFWRALVEYAKPTDDNDKHEKLFQQVLPDLTPFCQYISEYYFRPEEVNSVSFNDSQEQSQETTGDQSTDDSVIKDKSKKKSNKPSEAVLVHLLEMCRAYDMADEMGRTSVKNLCIDFLQNPAVNGESVPVLARLLNHVVPSVSAKLSIMAEIITELREPLLCQSDKEYVPNPLLLDAEEKKQELQKRIEENIEEKNIAIEIDDMERVEELNKLISSLEKDLEKLNKDIPQEPGRDVNNDPAILKKCLTIVVEILNCGDVQAMDATLYSLMENFIMPTLSLEFKSPLKSAVKNLALQALGAFCILDGKLAKNNFLLFCYNVANDIMVLTALKCLYDSLYVHGLQLFDIDNKLENENIRSNENDRREQKMIKLLVSLLNNDSVEIRKTSVIGLCRLLMVGRIKSHSLISKLIMLWYSPVVAHDPHVRQVLGVFFQVFSQTSADAPELLQKAFVPTLKEFFNLEVTDPMAEVDVENVANLLVDLTRPGLNSRSHQDVSVHNKLAIELCEELLTEEYETPNLILLLKVINNLELNFQNNTDINIVIALTTRLMKGIRKENKAAHRLVVKLQTKLNLNRQQDESLSTVCNTLSPNSTCGTVTTCKITAESLLARNSTDDSESEVKSSQDLSPDLTVNKENVCQEKMVISSSSEFSDGSETSSDYRGPSVKTFKLSENFKQPENRRKKTSSKVSAKTSTKVANTPVKSATKTPAKTPARQRRPVSNKNSQTDETPQKKPVLCDRVTRSARKRKSP